MYKSLAKELANRLRLVILKHHIRGSVRVLIADEVVDNARKNDKELLLLKVDFEKVYDSINRKYLDAVMGKMNFPV